MRGIHGPREGAVLPTSSGERKSLGNRDKILSPANERSRHTRPLQYPAFLPFHTLFSCLNSEGKTPLEWKKPGVMWPPSLSLLSPFFSQESHIEFILLACVLVTERFEGQKPWLSPFPSAPQTSMPRWGPLLLLSVTLRHAHRWCCCCSAC